MTREEALQHFKKIELEVSDWPEWKKNLLRDSLEPTLPEPRPPVRNTKPEKEFALVGVETESGTK